MNTIVINLLAGPGVGKSTFAARLFVALKEYHLSVELVREFPKDLTWEERFNTLMNQVYVFGMQHHMIWILKGKVDIIIVEGSIVNSIAYDVDDNKELVALMLSEFHKFNNLNYFLERKVNYQNDGRRQSLDEAKTKDDEIIKILEDNSIKYQKVDPKDREQFLFIVEDIRKIHQSMINN